MAQAISVLSPASFAKPERVDRGIERLRTLGFAPRLLANTQKRGPLFFAGTPEERLADFHVAFATLKQQSSPVCAAVTRSNYLLDGLDLSLIKQHPKPFAAYSDLTGIQLHLLDRLGLPVFHGPMVAADFASRGRSPFGQLPIRTRRQTLFGRRPRRPAPLKPGVATGTLYGGASAFSFRCLTLHGKPPTEGKLLFIEEPAPSPIKSIACSGSCASPENSTASAASSSAKCSTAPRPAAIRNLLDDVILHAFRECRHSHRHRSPQRPCSRPKCHTHLRRAGRTSSHFRTGITSPATGGDRMTTARHIHLTGICGHCDGVVGRPSPIAGSSHHRRPVSSLLPRTGRRRTPHVAVAHPPSSLRL